MRADHDDFVFLVSTLELGDRVVRGPSLWVEPVHDLELEIDAFVIHAGNLEALADAMRRHPKAFDTLYVNMVAAGEAGGILDTILKRLAIYIEKNVKLKGQVKSAMIYPVAVMTIAGLVVAVILWKVIPTFANLFAGLGAELPLPTRVVIALSNNLVRFGPFLIVGAVGASYAFKQYYAEGSSAGIDSPSPLGSAPVVAGAEVECGMRIATRSG